MGKIGLMVMLFATALALLGCTAVREGTQSPDPREAAPSPAAGYRNITPEQLQSQLGSEGFVLIDTHIPEQEHLRGTDAFIPYDEIEDRLDELPSDKDAKIVLYCRSGRMSRIAAEKLMTLGYTDVHNLVGGTEAWKEEGYPIP